MKRTSVVVAVMALLAAATSSGAGAAQSVQTMSTTNAADEQPLESGDFNGDGMDDVARFDSATGRWWVSLSTGTGFATSLWADFTTAAGWEARRVGDFNGDGSDDIAQFHPSNGTWWVSLSTGTGFATSLWADFATATGWQGRVVGDFGRVPIINHEAIGDGRDDIAQFHPGNGTWWVFESTGQAFDSDWCNNDLITNHPSDCDALWADFVTAAGWEAHLVGDFNGDGADDIAQFHPSNGTWWVSITSHLSHAFIGVVEEAHLDTIMAADFVTAAGWEARLVGDFNGDGDDDIAQFHPGNGTWWVSISIVDHHIDATGPHDVFETFATTLWADFTTAAEWEGRRVGDFNGDGADDIAQFHSSDGTWWVSLSTGTGFATSLWTP